MANPQKENGFVPIATELFNALVKLRIPGEARQVLDFIILKTYGYNKKSDWISNSQFVKGTGVGKTHIDRSIEKLLQMNLITQKGNGVTEKGKPDRLTYSINKDYDTWKPLPKKVTVAQKGNGVTRNGRTITKLGKGVTLKGGYNIQSTINTLTIDNLQQTSLRDSPKIMQRYVKSYQNSQGHEIPLKALKITDEFLLALKVDYPSAKINENLMEADLYLIDLPNKKYKSHNLFFRNWVRRSLNDYEGRRNCRGSFKLAKTSPAISSEEHERQIKEHGENVWPS
jgi:phage replication O-like protein O